MSRVHWRALFMLALLVLSISASWGVWRWKSFTHSPLPLEQAEILNVERGSSVRALAGQLAGQFGQPEIFWRLLYRLHGEARPLQAGEYQLSPGVTPLQLLHMLLEGQVVQHRFRIQEGWNWRQLQQALQAEDRLLQDLNPQTLAALQRQLAPEQDALEGLFFPDTYRFQRGSRASELLLRAGRLMQSTLQQAWQQRDLQQTAVLETPYQALILASIVEKETALAEEMPRIAGVFLNRLRKGMRLQTDPTVIYGMGERFDGNIRRKDLRTPTPWNTYVIPGLPPTPICMPGAQAIAAVMRPEAHDYLFFVADGSGGHVFSREYEAHRKAVMRYQMKSTP